ncbi:MAG: hypothetical protein A2035_08035 [Nitrospirae bacterium GWA2_42_11]|nr:MAG: hypothetical protein A2035_08035 [Nitrospirae bacterium GWA2_42_11]OGW58628.1 MAG: hypothetical protein A3D21_06495 [Nitrospirae bacterium RIFCSPHIGHO2_02_FULL_42_12]
MKLLKNGKNILVSVENISSFGIWLFVKGKEYFLSYDEYPYFKDQTLKSIQNVKLLHGFHLYWPDIDVDLEIDNLEHPEKYPLKSKYINKKSNKTLQRTA